MRVTRTWVPSWSNVILIWYHYIVICTVSNNFLRIVSKISLVKYFSNLSLTQVSHCTGLRTCERASSTVFCFWYKRQLKNYHYIYVQYTLSTVCKSAQYYCRAFISINGRRINYKYIIATNSFMCVITIFRLYNMEENCLMLHLYGR